MTKAGRLASVLALALVFSATWFILDRSEGRPRWLTVEAPEYAVVGRPLEVRVTLADAVEPARISCTLHRAKAGRKEGNFLASAGPDRPAAGGGTYSFVFVVPEHKDMDYAFALIFLSPTGEWRDGTRAVTSRRMPVRRDSAAAGERELVRTPLYRYPTVAESAAAAGRPAARRAAGKPSAATRPVLAALLLAGAALSLVRAGRSRAAARAEAASERAVWLAFAAVLALGAALEVSGLAGNVVSAARRLAEEANVYEARKAFQKVVMAAVAAAGLGLFLIFLRAVRRPGPHRCLWWAGIGLAVYVSVSFVSVLSFHAVDVARGMTWGGISLVDAVRGAGGLVALVAAAAALGTAGGKAPS
jgi:hypothetical protein